MSKNLETTIYFNKNEVSYIVECARTLTIVMANLLQTELNSEKNWTRQQILFTLKRKYSGNQDRKMSEKNSAIPKAAYTTQYVSHCVSSSLRSLSIAFTLQIYHKTSSTCQNNVRRQNHKQKLTQRIRNQIASQSSRQTKN